MGKQWKQWQTLFSRTPKITVDGDCSHEIKMHTPCKKSYDKPRQHIKKQRHYFAFKSPFNQSYGFTIVMYVCASWTIKNSLTKNRCLWTVVLRKTLESPLDSKEIKLVNPKGNQPWMFIGKTDAKAETPVLWPPHANWLIGKDPNAGRD